MDRDENWHWTNESRSPMLTNMSASITESATQLERLAGGVRSAIDGHADWSHTAQLVADQLRAHLPGPDVLTPDQRLGSPDRAAGHTLHVEPDGSFSITAVVWRPGQATPIHDHTTWCVFGVIQGIEHEDVYDADLNLIGSNDNLLGDVNGFAPPGDIHRVHNTGDEVAISIHIYGTDVTRIGSSVRRYYGPAT
jgi:predicted metal-dependent enzyme (double-stranded beta helix superfamily)